MDDLQTAPDSDDYQPSSIFRAREEGARLQRALIVLAPLGLALDIVLSLWISYQHVRQSSIVQVEPQWVVGEQLAVRAQLVDVREGAVDGVRASLTLHAGDEARPLAVLEPVKRGIAQGHIQVPALPAGKVELELELGAAGREPMIETIPVEIVDRRQPRSGEHTISTSVLQWADDTDPQPESVRIDVRPFGRILAGFDNELLVRVTDPVGKPWIGAMRVLLVHGELGGETGKEHEPPVLFDGETSALGLASIGGRLDSEVLRVEVELQPAPVPGPAAAPGAPEPAAPIRRRFRFVSFPGGVQVDVAPAAARPGTTLEIVADSLRRNRPVFVDLHAPDGAWVGTLMPPLVAGEAAREQSVPASIREGFVQVEAYHYTNDPGEGTALARVFVSETDPDSAASLAPLIARQQALLELPRIDKEFDIERERKYLEHVASADLTPPLVTQARHWLIGSLPVEVHGPPTALMTQVRDEEALAAKKQRWATALRAFLWGGGALFILVFAVSVMRADRQSAKRLAAALFQGNEEDAGAVAERLMTQRRAMLFRAAIVVAILVATLVLTATLMESFVWIA